MPSYRIELAKGGRAGCTSTECKKKEVKIGKGELRFGVLVEIKEHQSWVWRHWGCTTPKQLENWKNVTGGDFELADGLEELPEDVQEKVKRAIEQGHVDDEDWRGDLEMNKAGEAGSRKKTPKKRKSDDQGEGEEGSESPSKKGGRPKKNDNPNDEGQPAPAPKKPGRPKKSEGQDGEEDAKPAPKKRGRPKKVDAGDDEGEMPAPKKARAKAKQDENKSEPEGTAQASKTAKGRRKKAKMDESEGEAGSADLDEAPNPDESTAKAREIVEATVESDKDAPPVQEASKSKRSRKITDQSANGSSAKSGQRARAKKA